MAKISQIDWDIIDARVQTANELHRLRTASMGFLWLVLDQFFPSLQDSILDDITDGPNDRGVDAIHIIEHDETAEVYIFQSKYRDSISTTDKTINDSEALRVGAFIEDIFDKSENIISCGNFRLVESVKKIWELHESGVICRYQIVFCSNGNGLSISASNILKSVCDKHGQVHFEFYGPRDLIRDLASDGKRRETGTLRVIGKEVFERTDGDVRGVIASVDANSFVDLIKTPDGQSVKRYLFDDNLRVFLGSQGGYNPSIIETATSNDSHLFWYLNNGITITCSKYSYNKGHSNPKISMDDFQIVNGAQTSHSLLEASRINPYALDNVVIMVRVYATDREDITERVAVATNSQARIQSRDLKANNSVMKKLELAFAERQYYFERKRNMHSDKESARRIDALKLGQIIMAFSLKEPDRAKGESDSIFDSRFQAIFHESLDVDELIKLFEMYRIIELLKAEFLNKTIHRTDSASEYQYLVYGNWFVLYAAGLIHGRSRSKALPSGEEAKKLILEALSLVARACSQPRAIAHYQMFRSPKTKEKILSELDGKQPDLFAALEG